MLRPSYSDLLEVLNKDADTENVIGSRYRSEEHTSELQSQR